MSVDEIKATVTQLNPSDLAEFAAWLEEYCAQAWDKQIEDDLKSGRLDALLKEVKEEYEGGLSQPL